MGGELSELKNRLEDPSLTQEQRQSDERRIEKIEKAIELFWSSFSNTFIPTEESNSFNLQGSRDLFNLTFV
ncbi:MAG: hypothetical protein EBR67_08295 [Proteobacteria bacterium]|nr:hypothetical protein [Pseudomonadota bacterium]